jgi:hypothetical protein
VRVGWGRTKGATRLTPQPSPLQKVTKTKGKKIFPKLRDSVLLHYRTAIPQTKTADPNRGIRRIRGRLHFAYGQEILAKLSELDGVHYKEHKEKDFYLCALWALLRLSAWVAGPAALGIRRLELPFLEAWGC